MEKETKEKLAMAAKAAVLTALFVIALGLAGRCDYEDRASAAEEAKTAQGMSPDDGVDEAEWWNCQTEEASHGDTGH